MFDPPVSTPMARMIAERRVAQALVLDVGQGLLGRHGDGVAGVDAHRVDVLDGADDDHVVLVVAHHLEFELLPADHRLLEQHLADRARRRDRPCTAASKSARVSATPPPCPPMVKLGRMIRGRRRPPARASCASARVRTTDGRGHAQADGGHGGAELVPGLGPVDGRVVGAQQLHTVALERAVLGQSHGQVEGGLAAQGGQQGVGPLPLDDPCHHFGHQRLDVGAVGERGVGHDGGRVGVHQHHLVALLQQDLAGLGAGVVELAGLPDDDRPGSEQHDLLDVGAAGHPARPHTAWAGSVAWSRSTCAFLSASPGTIKGHAQGYRTGPGA